MLTCATAKNFLARLVLGSAVLTSGCASTKSYQVFYHQTFTRFGHLPNGFRSGTGTPGQAIEITGIYDLQDFRPDSLPVLQLCDSLRQPITIYLSDRLACESGSLVQVSGHTIADNSTLPGQVLLHPTAFQRIASTQMICEHASAEYQKIKPKLEQAITPPESRLKLPAQPEWQLFWLADPGSVILRTVCADLMYAASVEFVYDFASLALKQVYAHEYFKGE